MKHGGISDADAANFLLDKTYDDITKKSLINYTIEKKILETDEGINVILRQTEIPISKLC